MKWKIVEAFVTFPRSPVDGNTIDFFPLHKRGINPGFDWGVTPDYKPIESLSTL